MKRDIKSNFAITENLAIGTLASGANNGTAVDMSDGASAAFVCELITDGTAGSVAFKLQHSADGTTDWTDEAAGAGNSAEATLTGGDGLITTLHVVNPRRRYYRVVATASVADATGGIIAMVGPLNSVQPA